MAYVGPVNGTDYGSPVWAAAETVMTDLSAAQAHAKSKQWQGAYIILNLASSAIEHLKQTIHDEELRQEIAERVEREAANAE